MAEQQSQTNNQDQVSEDAPDDELSEGEISDGGLKIVLESPSPKKKPKALIINPAEKEAIESVENDLEEGLDEKAARANLKSHDVKKILKHVVTNEDVLAMVRNAENPEESGPPTPFEPKLTRAKAKQLLSSQPVIVPNIPWVAPATKSSSVSVLMSEELQEDSSGDEYVPCEDESEDDRESSFLSEPSLSEPPTPTSCDMATQTNWSEDGVFKIPATKEKEQIEEANIALRTRSKLCLSSTPLEVIEEAFIPPDITTDMYDMDVDDDDWKDFLKKFCRPLDEVTKNAEDDDHDPEYNVLADEEIDKVDKEELRADKAVKVTRKELNELIAELFEYTDIYNSNLKENQISLELQNEPEYTVLEEEAAALEQSQPAEEPQQSEYLELQINADQKLLLDQQMRQHVQLLTQHFLLTYGHPEYHDVSATYKEYLINFKLLGEANNKSAFRAHNLYSALNLIEDWEKKFLTEDDEVLQTKKFVAKVAHEVTECKHAGLEYIPTFPPLLLKTVSESNVFLYPGLLPRIPFKPSSALCNKSPFIPCENELIAIGLEQFLPYLEGDPKHLTRKGEVNLKSAAHFIRKYILPVKEAVRLYKHIIDFKHPRSTPNPIKYYFQNKRAPVTMHYVIPLDVHGCLPPKQRKSHELPVLWRKYIYPDINLSQNTLELNNTIVVNIQNNVNNAVNSGPRHNKKLKITSSTPITGCGEKRLIFSTEKNLSNIKSKKVTINKSISKNIVKKKTLTSSLEFRDNPPPGFLVIKYLKKLASQVVAGRKMMPSMPFLDFSSCKNENCTSNNLETSIVASEEDDEPTEKEVVDDSTLKTVTNPGKIQKKNPSGAEKKRAKLRRNFQSTLNMLSPEDPAVLEEKSNIYAQAYYDKVREQLDVDDYHKVMEILNGHDETTDATTDLYKKLEQVFLPKHPDLAEEFLTFLTPLEARSIGKYVPYCIMSNMSLFLRKLEIYFKDQPHQVRKIYRSISELSTCLDITMEKVKSIILPLLKGNRLLIDWFLQIFPMERPPDSLLNGTWENMEIGDDGLTDNSGYETIIVPEVEDPYGGPNCSCNCHNVDDAAFKSRTKHCVPCGTKFMQGRIYLQTGKGLRLANITFDKGSPVEHFRRLNCWSLYKRKKRSDASPTKAATSPNKDTQEEVRMSNDSDDEAECGKKRPRQARAPRKKKVKKAPEKSTKTTKTVTEQKSSPTIQQKLDNIIDAAIKGDEVKDEVIEKTSGTENTTSDSSLNETKPSQADETAEWDCNTSVESIELRLSPEPSAGSESEFCEESSQDNLHSETDNSGDDSDSASVHSAAVSDNSNSNNFDQVMLWTREEDKIILETFQKEDDKEKAFVRISELLESRTRAQIEERFTTLMNLLREMAAAVAASK